MTSCPWHRAMRLCWRGFNPYLEARFPLLIKITVTVNSNLQYSTVRIIFSMRFLSEKLDPYGSIQSVRKLIEETHWEFSVRNSLRFQESQWDSHWQFAIDEASSLRRRSIKMLSTALRCHGQLQQLSVVNAARVANVLAHPIFSSYTSARWDQNCEFNGTHARFYYCPRPHPFNCNSSHRKLSKRKYYLSPFLPILHAVLLHVTTTLKAYLR